MEENSKKLNDLSGKEWVKFTKSWFVHDPPPRKGNEFLHPAKFPETMIKGFIKFFTKKENIVFDPFLGSGSTLVASMETGRNGIGIELMKKYAKISKERCSQESLFNSIKQKVIEGDSSKIDEIWKENNLPEVDFIITSPPYWNMLKKSRGGVKSAQKKRQEMGLDTHYSEDKRDVGNIDDYEVFIEKIGDIFDKTYEVLKRGKYMVVIIQNVRTNGEVKPLAWDLQRRISKKFTFVGEKIWCQDAKMLGIWGYPSTFVTNVHHHYCLVFQKQK